MNAGSTPGGPMDNNSRDKSALAVWEGEGGGAGDGTRDGNRNPACGPSLPAGYEAQPDGGFHDPTGRFSYEFNRVYGAPDQLDDRGPACRLDRDLSYWSVTWPIFGEAGDERPTGRWMNFAQARMRPGLRLTFERFSSLPQMRDQLYDLLQVADADAAEPHHGH